MTQQQRTAPTAKKPQPAQGDAVLPRADQQIEEAQARLKRADAHLDDLFDERDAEKATAVPQGAPEARAERKPTVTVSDESFHRSNTQQNGQ